jgi:hypothetical protein
MDSLEWEARVPLLSRSRWVRQCIALGLGGVLLLGILVGSAVGAWQGWEYSLPTLGLVGLLGLAGLGAMSFKFYQLVEPGVQFRFTLSDTGIVLAPVDARLLRHPQLAPVALGLLTHNSPWITSGLQGQTSPQQLQQVWDQIPRLVLDASQHTLTLIQPQGEAWIICCTPEVFPRVVQRVTGLLGHWQTTSLTTTQESLSQAVIN